MRGQNNHRSSILENLERKKALAQQVKSEKRNIKEMMKKLQEDAIKERAAQDAKLAELQDKYDEAARVA